MKVEVELSSSTTELLAKWEQCIAAMAAANEAWARFIDAKSRDGQGSVDGVAKLLDEAAAVCRAFSSAADTVLLQIRRGKRVDSKAQSAAAALKRELPGFIAINQRNLKLLKVWRVALGIHMRH